VGKARQRPRGTAVYAAVLAVVTLAISGVVGLIVKQPWLFPSLGPTVMLFFESPEQPASRPLNTIAGHTVGISAGLGCYTALGLSGHPSTPVGGLTVSYVMAGVLAVGITTAVLSLLKLPHPPAGASTLIVALGILHPPPRTVALHGGRRTTDHSCRLGVQPPAPWKSAVTRPLQRGGDHRGSSAIL
jgi:CBS-domain-containing membrane protein